MASLGLPRYARNEGVGERRLAVKTSRGWSVSEARLPPAA